MIEQQAKSESLHDKGVKIYFCEQIDTAAELAV